MTKKPSATAWAILRNSVGQKREGWGQLKEKGDKRTLLVGLGALVDKTDAVLHKVLGGRGDLEDFVHGSCLRKQRAVSREGTANSTKEKGYVDSLGHALS